MSEFSAVIDIRDLLTSGNLIKQLICIMLTIQNVSTTSIYLTEGHSYAHQWIKFKQAEIEMAYSRVSENSTVVGKNTRGDGVYGGPWTSAIAECFRDGYRTHYKALYKCLVDVGRAAA